MTVTLQNAMNGLAAFAEQDALPHMPNGVKKVGAYMTVEAFRRNPNLIIKPYEQFFKMLGVISEESSTVDVDALSGYLKSAMQNVPTVNIWGFTFDASDIDKLIARIGG